METEIDCIDPMEYTLPDNSELHNEQLEVPKSLVEERTRYNIGIQFLHKGCIVSVGCKKIAFSDNNEAIKAIQKYSDDPIGMQETWENVLY